jgi:cell division protein FtsB
MDFYRKQGRGVGLRTVLHRVVRNRRLMLLLVVGAPIALYVVFGPRGVLKRIQLQREKGVLEQQIREAEAEQRALQGQSKALDGDKAAIEKVAREKYGMVKDGETVYKVHRKDK